MRQKLVQAVSREYLPDAMAAGRAAAEPILHGLKGRSIKLRTAADVRRALHLRGAAAKWHRQEVAYVRKLFVAELNGQSKGLSAQAEAVFMRARHDAITNGKGVRGLATALARADKSMLNAGLKRRQNLRKATKVLRDAERAGDEPGTKAARKQMTKARRGAKRMQDYTFIERFEAQARGMARNSVRRTAQETQQAYFRNAGYGPNSLYTYVAANGTDACPDCQDRHGETMTETQWRGSGPAEGTFCGDACCCQLVPAEYSASNKSLDKPLSLDRPEGKGVTPTHPDGPEPAPVPRRTRKAPKRAQKADKPKPRKVGGENARLAKEAKKMAVDKPRAVLDDAGMKVLKTVPDTPALRAHGVKAARMDKATMDALSTGTKQVQDVVRPEIAKLLKKVDVGAVRSMEAGVTEATHNGERAFVGIDRTRKISKSASKHFVDASLPGSVRHELGHAILDVMPLEQQRALGVFPMKYTPSTYAEITPREKWAEFFTEITKPGFDIKTLPREAQVVARRFLK